MSDLIRREDLMALWDEYHPYIATKAIEFDNKLRQLPSSYPKKGKWIQVTEYDIDNNATFECSTCGGRDTHAKGVNVSYCWHCGADMRER